jgi:hypothetical protein
MADDLTEAWLAYRADIVRLHETAADALGSGEAVEGDLAQEVDAVLEAAEKASTALEHACEDAIGDYPIDESVAEKVLAAGAVDLMVAGDAFALDPELPRDLRSSWPEGAGPEDRARFWAALLAAVDALFHGEDGGGEGRDPLLPHGAPSPGLLTLPAEGTWDEVEAVVAQPARLRPMAGAAVDPSAREEVLEISRDNADEVIELAATPTFALVVALLPSPVSLFDELAAIDPTGLLGDLRQQASGLAKRGIGFIYRFVTKLLVHTGIDSIALVNMGLGFIGDQVTQGATDLTTRRLVHPVLRKAGDHARCLRQIDAAVDGHAVDQADRRAIAQAQEDMLDAFKRHMRWLGVPARSSSFWAPLVTGLVAPPFGVVAVGAVYTATAGCIGYGLRARYDTLPQGIPRRRPGIPSTVSAQLQPAGT